MPRYNRRNLLFPSDRKAIRFVTFGHPQCIVNSTHASPLRQIAAVRDSASLWPAPGAAAPPNVGSVYLIHDIFRGELP